jgi:hypothetical protein
MLTLVYRLLALAFVAVSFAGTASAHAVVAGLPDVGIEPRASAGPGTTQGAIAFVATQAELVAYHGCDGSSHPGTPCCPGTHVHCCAASPALLSRDMLGLNLMPPARRAWGSFEAALPAGQRTYPPLRPPRISA